jgi:hypothetical protein
MNLRNISANQIVVWSALLLGLLAAVVIGSAVGSSDFRPVGGVFAVIAAAIIFVKLKTSIWVLIPIGWYLAGRLPWLPLPFTVRDLCFMTVIFCFAIFFATRTIPWRRKLSTIDYLVYINLAYLVTVFARNPVGFWAIQSDMVGGRPYFEVGLAFGAYAILSRVEITPFLARIFPFFFVVPTFAVAALDSLGRLVPQLALPLSRLYTGVGGAPAAAILQQETKVGETRLTAFKHIGETGIVALCAKFNPLTLITPFYPFRMAMFVGVAVLLVLAGFRSSILFAAVIFLLGSLLRGRFRDLWVSAALVVLGAVTLVSMQGTLIELPRTMQRALSWIPGGEWGPEAKEDAESSSRWRWEMVEWAINDDRLLRNKVWGQGFGLSLDELNIIAAALTSGQQGSGFVGGSDREQFLITGTFHNGPISAVKYVGVVGLVLFLVLIFYLAVSAWKTCIAARGTKAFSLAFFIAAPIIYFPFSFIVLTGFYEVDLPSTIFSAGLLNMVANYLRTLRYQNPVKRGTTPSLTFGQESKVSVGPSVSKVSVP